jgi:hypothetical protein
VARGHFLSSISVPVRFAGGRIEVRLGPERVEALDGKAIVARHARAVAKGTEVLVLDHYPRGGATG